jgi:23S rRNA pseudouridine1911/1915/1917 synthase
MALRDASISMEKLFEVIFENDDLLVINKPAGLVCHPTKGDEYSSLVSRIRLHLGPDIAAHLVNRLDRETSGVAVAAKNEDAEREIRHLWELRLVSKEYMAIVHGHPAENYQKISAALGKDMASEVAIRDTVVENGAASETEFWVEKRFIRTDGEFALLRVMPRTGRKHQIRIHLSHAGHPSVGDKMYGLDPCAYLAFVQDRLTQAQHEMLRLPWQALHATRLDFQWRGTKWKFEAPPEPWFDAFHLDGEAL